MCSKTILIIAFLASSVLAKQVILENKRKVDLTVSVSGQDDLTLGRKEKKILNLENWTGEISACTEQCDGPRTVVDLSIDSNSSTYGVSLKNGFNLAIKVIPIKSKMCRPSLCANMKIIKKCSLESQVKDVLGNVVACKNNAIMESWCPNAVPMSCDNAESLKVIIG